MSDRRHDCDDHGDQFVADCRVRLAADLFAHTWNPVVLTALRAGPRRRHRLRAEIGGISDKVLTETLRRLERAGLVERAAYAEAPPRVDYALTALGRSLVDGPARRARALVARPRRRAGRASAARVEAEGALGALGGTGRVAAIGSVGVTPCVGGRAQVRDALRRADPRLRLRLVEALAAAREVPVESQQREIPAEPDRAGPYCAQRSSSTCATCSSSKRVCSGPSGVSRSAIQLTSPPNSHVAANERGGSQASIVPPALPCSWYLPPSFSSPLTGRNQRGIRSGSVQASHRSSSEVG